MIKLKNVSKYYYGKGVVASGITKVNLEFNVGEFVAITGESGSGKSTLLNVISGLDTYEEGEMYINGLETSHYSEEDFENYRRKYVSNIYQNFNLVNSYTVYQNIELVLLLNGETNIKDKVLELIDKVNLKKFKNTKVSKLSGGQKQRVAIARALAKETQIIIADEPTGNLDSKQAKDIMKLLYEISKDKLVIVVTHNFEQVEEYATRKIKMHDGKVLEDKKLRDYSKVEDVKTKEYDTITFFNKLRLGFRNTFNIIPKFLLLLAVFTFVIFSLFSEYASFKKSEYQNSISGENYYFNNTSDKRVVIKKKDKSSFSSDDYDKISKLDNVDKIVKTDLLLDSTVNITDENNFWLDCYAKNINEIKKVDYGRMPENDSEVVIKGQDYMYEINDDREKLLQTTLYMQDYSNDSIVKDIPLKVVGIIYEEENNDYEYSLYVSDSVLDELSKQINKSFSKTTVYFQYMYYKLPDTNEFNVIPSQYVPSGSAYISDDYSYKCPKENCINSSVNVGISNIYFNDSINLTVTKTYTNKNIKNLLGLEDFERYNGSLFINSNDYYNMFNRDPFQSSVFVKDQEIIDDTIKQLNDLGIETLKMTDVIAPSTIGGIIQILRAIVTVVLVIVLFFISYFVIKLIMKSRNVYYSTLRMLGSNKNVLRQLIIFELLNITTLAYLIFIGLIYLNNINVIDSALLKDYITYLKLRDYILLYIIPILMSYLISLKYSRKLFKDSAIQTINEGV